MSRTRTVSVVLAVSLAPTTARACGQCVDHGVSALGWWLPPVLLLFAVAAVLEIGAFRAFLWLRRRSPAYRRWRMLLLAAGMAALATLPTMGSGVILIAVFDGMLLFAFVRSVLREHPTAKRPRLVRAAVLVAVVFLPAQFLRPSTRTTAELVERAVAMRSSGLLRHQRLERRLWPERELARRDDGLAAVERAMERTRGERYAAYDQESLVRLHFRLGGDPRRRIGWCREFGLDGGDREDEARLVCGPPEPKRQTGSAVGEPTGPGGPEDG